MIRQLLAYFNPMAHLGDRRYSVVLPFLLTFIVWTFSELYALVIRQDPEYVGFYVIYLAAVLVTYSAFREGIWGGLMSTTVTLLYYVYILISRDFSGDRLVATIFTIVNLAIIYVLLALVVGWLKQTIDALIIREANEKRHLQTILQQLPVGVLVTNDQGRVTHVNHQVRNMLGFEVPVGWRLLEQLEREGSQKSLWAGNALRPLKDVLQQEQAVMGEEIEIKRPDGKRLTLQLNASPVLNGENRVVAAVEVIQDVTLSKEIEQRKDDFVNMASHELKTPLTSMKLYLDLLKQSLLSKQDTRVQRLLDRIHQQTGRFQDLVNELLDVSRLQTGKLSFTLEKFRLDELIQETVEELQATDPQRQILFRSPKNAITLTGDTFRIYQVLTNLLSNAMKYSPPKSQIVVEVKTNSQNVVVSVKDQGIGIDKGQQHKIFDRLYQVTDVKEKTFPGLGMGLYISKEIITRHRGKIWVESRKGDGSTFYFRLPLRLKSTHQEGKT